MNSINDVKNNFFFVNNCKYNLPKEKIILEPNGNRNSISTNETFENELVFTFDTHKQLFGERKTVMNAEKEVVKSDEEDEDKDKDKDKEDDGGGLDILGMILGSQEEQKKKLQEQAKNTDVGDLANADDLTGEDEDKPATEKVPITTKEEAMRFGLKKKKKKCAG